MRILNWLTALFILILVACDEGTKPPPVPQATRIEITPGSVLFTKTGDNQVFTAQVYDQNGAIMTSQVIWASSNTAVINVTADGTATALANSGSVQLTASVGTVKTVSVVLIAQPVAGAVLVTDDQIIKAEALDPAATYQVGYQYVVTLQGVAAPAIGAVLMTTGTLPIAGKVIAVSSDAGQTKVTLEVVPLSQLFVKIQIQETVGLGQIPAVIPEKIQEFFTVTSNGAGQYTFKLKPGKVIKSKSVNRALPSVGVETEFDVGPMECSASTSAIKVELDKAEVNLDLSQTKLDFAWNDLEKKILLVGDTKITFAFKPKISAAFVGKLDCKLTFSEIPIPFPGVLGFVVTGEIPFGAGFEIAGKLPIANIGYEASSEYTVTTKAGLACLPDCQLFKDFSVTDPKTVNKWVLPAMPTGLKVEASAYGFLFADFNAAAVKVINQLGKLVGVNIKHFQFIEAKLGYKLEAKLAAEDTQALDTKYSSDYKLLLEGSIGTGKDLTKVLEFLEVPITKGEINFTKDLATSPTAISATADKSTFKFEDTVNFKVKLGNLEFPFVGYNIDSVRIYRKETRADGSTALILVNEVTASAGQSEFDLPWVATVDGELKDNFLVFVKTKLLTEVRLEVATVVLGPCKATATVKYCVTDIPGFKPFLSNDLGQIFGLYKNGFVYLWQNNQYTTLYNYPDSYILGFNNLGQILTAFLGATKDNSFVWEKNILTKITDQEDTQHLYASPQASAINDSGQVVGMICGFAPFVDGCPYFFLWQNGNLVRLNENRPEIFGKPFDINNLGQILGNFQDLSDTETLDQRGNIGIWQNGALKTILKSSLDNNFLSTALKINDKTQVMGTAVTPQGGNPFLWQNGQLLNLGNLPNDDITVATDINNSGQIVGYSYKSSVNNVYHGFLWQNGTMSDLADLTDNGISNLSNPLGSYIDINDKGQIIINGHLLTPAQP